MFGKLHFFLEKQLGGALLLTQCILSLVMVAERLPYGKEPLALLTAFPLFIVSILVYNYIRFNLVSMACLHSGSECNNF